MSATKIPKSTLIKTIIITLVIFAVIGAVIYGLTKSVNSNEEPIVLQGEMEMQSTAIAAKVPGRITRILVTEGDTVTAGQQLIEMDAPEINAKIKQAEASRDMAQSQLNKAEAGARPQDIGRAKAAWNGNQAAADLAKSTYERVNRLYQEGLMARQKRDEAYTQYIANQEQANAARLQYELAQEGARDEDKQAASAQVAQVDAVIEEAQAAQNEANLKSPISGIVDNVIVNAGEVIGQGVPIMTLVNPKDQWLVLNVTETNLNHFVIGAQFLGTIPALSTPDAPYQLTFKVYNTASMPDFATWRATNSQDEFDTKTFEVKARPLQPNVNIRSGMSVLVDLGVPSVDTKNTDTQNTDTQNRNAAIRNGSSEPAS